MAEPELVPVFMPPLVALLLHAERDKKRPLTEAEVFEILDEATCVLMPVEDARALAERRGYADLDPNKAWEEWQRARVELAGPEIGDAAPE